MGGGSLPKPTNVPGCGHCVHAEAVVMIRAAARCRGRGRGLEKCISGGLYEIMMMVMVMVMEKRLG